MHINRPLVAVAAVAASLLAASAVVLSTAAEGNSGSRVITVGSSPESTVARSTDT